MIVVAGPSGSGKSVRFNVFDFQVDAFNVDDRCRELHGSYEGIPAVVREQAQAECQEFVQEHILAGKSFATETTLRTRIAIEQAEQAKRAGFFTAMIYVALEDVAINIERVRLRGLGAGHSALPEVILENYSRSLRNLAAALEMFNRAEVYDNTGHEPRLVLQVQEARVQSIHAPVPQWIREALRGSQLGGQLS